MDLLDAAVLPYDWGSHRLIADLQGRTAPSAGPEAELWMGAHPKAPSAVQRGGRERTLDEVVGADPEGELGSTCAGSFGGRLPFLLKVLAAEKALSIQVHPTRDQAREGYAREDAAGIPLGHRDRQYVDDWPKPEVVCALTPFEALAGFRRPDEAADMLAALNVDALAPSVERLRGGDADTLRDALRDLLRLPAPVLDEVSEACEQLIADGDVDAAPYRVVLRLALEHPGDLGAIVSLLMRYVVLEPGQGLYLAANGLHAYLRGCAVEVLANSDNVLRAGLTGKHVDVDELLRIVDPGVEVPLLAPVADADGVSDYGVGADEFRLYRVDRTGGTTTLPGAGPRIVLTVAGLVRLDAGGEQLEVPRGASCFIPATQPDVKVTGAATLFVACPGR